MQSNGENHNNSIENNMDLQSIKSMKLKPMPLKKRLMGSLIDIIIFIVIFLLVPLILRIREIGLYLDMFFMEPDNYRHMGDAYKFVDLGFTSIFVFIYLIYFFIFELFLHASLGNYLLGGIIYNSKQRNISYGKIMYRTLVRGIIMPFFLLGNHFDGGSYFMSFIMFLFITGLPLLFENKSLFDIFTKTYYVER